MTRAIPEQIVTAVTELAESLARWCEEGRDGRLEQHEAAVLERVRQVLPTLLEAVIEAATSGLAPRVRGQRSACPRCGRKVRPHQERPRQVLTQCGAVLLERPWYTCARCHHGWSVVETTLGVGSRQRSSAGLVAWLVRLGATTDYREAADLLDELTGQAVGAETIRRECLRVGTAIRTAEAAAIRQTQRTREAAEPLDPAPGLLVLEADGAMIQFTDGWHAVKIGMVAGWDRDRQVAPSYVAARASATDFGPRLATEAARRGALEVERWEGVSLAAVSPSSARPWSWPMARSGSGTSPTNTSTSGSRSPTSTMPLNTSRPSTASHRPRPRLPRSDASTGPTSPPASSAWTTHPSASMASRSAPAPPSPPLTTSSSDG